MGDLQKPRFAPILQHLARKLPLLRTGLRALVLAAALCAIAPRQIIGAPISIHCPLDITTSNIIGNCSAGVSFASTATPASGCDLLGIAYRIGSTQITSPHTFPVGGTTVEAGAADSCYNVATCTFRVTVVDTQPPTITCPTNVTVNADSSLCTASVPFAATVSDNCSVSTLKYYIGTAEITSPYSFPVGANTVTAQARDPNNNMASCQFSITVRDIVPPTITCPADISISASTGLCSAVALYVPTASDSCPFTLMCTPASGSAFPVGTTNVICTAQDSSGNTAWCTSHVRIFDTQPPSIICSPDTTVGNDPGRCDASVTMHSYGSDNCTVASLRYYVGQTQINNTHTFPLGSTDVRTEVRDPYNNMASCISRIKVNDTQPPSISCPATLRMQPDPGVSYASNVAVGTATATDACGVPTVIAERTDDKGITDPYPLGKTIITWMARDAAENSNSCTQEVWIATGFTQLYLPLLLRE